MKLDEKGISCIEKVGYLQGSALLDSAVALLQDKLITTDLRLFSQRRNRESTSFPQGDVLEAIRLVNRQVLVFMRGIGDVYESQVTTMHFGDRYAVGDVGEWHTDGVYRAFVALGGIANLEAAQGVVPEGDGFIGTLNYKPNPEQIVELDQGEVGIFDGITVHRRGPLKKHGWSIFVEASIRL